MTYKLLGREINVIQPEFYSTDSFYDHLKNNGYAFIKNAFNVDFISDNCLKNTIYSFDKNEVDETHLFKVEQHPELNKFVKESIFLNSLKNHIKPLYVQNSIFLRKKKNLQGYNIHRDGDCLLLSENKNINFGNHKKEDQFMYTIWTALKDVTPENSALCLLRREDVKINVESFWNARGNVEHIDNLFKKDEFLNEHKNWVSAKMNKGDCVIFSGDIIHASTDGLSGERTSFDIRVSNVDFSLISTYKIMSNKFLKKVTIKEIPKEEYFQL